ncbi:hypothetical protein LCGC14_2335960 [marine sediment metagenome]|uniref:HK97 gp10 family phage protein n=1 Tax=marine sediment metagenome TaxID=412755 RepID=A0A0F9CEC0_9ZZZZ
MSLKVQIKVLGLKEFIRKINTISNDQRKKVFSVISRGAIKIENTTKRVAPVKEGQLRANVNHEINIVRDRIFAKIGVNDNVGYALAVEKRKGTQARKPGKIIPYLKPSFRVHKKQILKDIKDAAKSLT